MKQYNSLSALFKDVGLSIAKKHKENNLTAIHPCEFAEKIDSIDIIENQDQVQLGEVKDIRFSIVGGILNICWNDPFDVELNGSVIAHFGMTKLLAKLDEYPENPEDGIVLYSSTTRDKHSFSALTIDLNNLGLIEENRIIHFKFFSATSGGYWNTNTLTDQVNKFTSSSYDWTMVYSALKDYPNSKDSGILPHAGDVVYLDYINRDYYIENGKNVAAETRADIVNNIDKLSSVSIPWRILGFNANVPQYVGYKTYDENLGQYRYIYVQSVDDRLSTVNCTDKSGNTSEIDIFIGDKQFRTITPGCRTYTEDEWDYTTNIKSYTDTGMLVQEVSPAVFGYDNEGTGTQNVYNVPVWINVDNKRWDFCGYTMTIQPQYLLNSYARSSDTAITELKTIQFDQTELRYAAPFNTFPEIYDESIKFYKKDENGINEIDWSSQVLGDINSLNYDVYKLESDNSLTLQTTYFQKYKEYYVYSLVDNVEVYEPLVEIMEFEQGVPYYKDCPAKSYVDTANPKPLSVYADVVRYNGELYVCKTNITNVQNNSTPDQLTAYFRALSSEAELQFKELYDNGMYFIVGQKIPTQLNGKNVVEQNQANTYGYGRNTHEESFYKQYCNNINGSQKSKDVVYKPQHRFDVISTTNNLANANSLMLKLFKEQQFIRHIVPAVNRTVISNPCGPYRKQYIEKNRQTWETSIDIFYPLALYEVFGSGADASSTFSQVYYDNESRIKRYMAADGTESSTAALWWLRHPHTGTSHTQSYVYTSGAQTTNIAHNSYGFSPACIIS